MKYCCQDKPGVSECDLSFPDTLCERFERKKIGKRVTKLVWVVVVELSWEH